MRFELKEGMEPYHGKPFPVPQILMDMLKQEVLRLVELGVLVPQPESELGSPTFIMPKKNMTVRFISDFREVNKLLKQKLFLIPKISDILQKLQGFHLQQP